MLRLFLLLFLLAAFIGLILVVSSPKRPDPSRDELPRDRVVLIILDGTNEEIFRGLLEGGKLPHLASLLEPGANGKRHGVYTAATTVWPSTTGPAYAPFLAGVYPKKSHLSGIRQYLRETKAFRAYIGWQTKEISEELSQEFPIIYEVLGRTDTFNQQGFVTRRGWRDDRSILHPLHENYISAPGAVARYGLGHIPENDLQNALSFLNYLSPEFDPKRFFAIGSFQGKFFDWGVRGRTGLLMEEIFSLAGLERVIRERDFGARKLGRLPSFSMISLHLPDDTSHGEGAGEEYLLALQKIDEIFAAITHVFRQQEALDNVTLIVSADHGTSTVGDGEDAHLNIIQRLSEDTGVPIHDSMRRMSDKRIPRWKEGEHRQWSGIGAVSGNANVQIYLRKPGAPLEDWTARPSYADLRAYQATGEGMSSTTPVDLVDALLRYEQVSHVYAADRKQGAYHVFTRQGEGVIRVRERPGGDALYSYEVRSGEDPLGYAAREATREMVGSGKFHDGNAWAAVTRDSGFPDGIVQVVQLLDGKNSGDLIADAAPRFEPWDQMQKGLHGALRREHIVVPLLIYGRRLDVEKAERLFGAGRLPRTVDVYPTILDLMGMRPPSRIRWGIPKLGGLLGSETREAEVRTDIDGESLSIWTAPPPVHRERAPL
jgi:arylsulfatase A-like enzyme